MTGEFEMGDDLSRFTSIVATTSPSFVMLSSPGGAIYKAMELGRLIRQHGLPTIALKPSDCVSACVLAFMGGIERYAEPGVIGVHRASFAKEAAIGGQEATAAIQQITADIMTYISAMGADPSLLQVAYNYDSADMRYLSKSEMKRYRVTTIDEIGKPPETVEQSTQSPQTVSAPSSQPSSATPSIAEGAVKPALPVARTGQVRYPEGYALLRAEAGENAPPTARLTNGSRVEILDILPRWYRVRVGNQTGFLHANWLKIDQFEPSKFSSRFIQIASYEDWPNVVHFLKYATLPVAVHFASNGWYAITLEDTFDAKLGLEILARMKAQNLIPADLFMTYGNTYAVRIK